MFTYYDNPEAVGWLGWNSEDPPDPADYWKNSKDETND